MYHSHHCISFCASPEPENISTGLWKNGAMWYDQTNFQFFQAKFVSKESKIFNIFYLEKNWQCSFTVLRIIILIIYFKGKYIILLNIVVLPFYALCGKVILDFAKTSRTFDSCLTVIWFKSTVRVYFARLTW